MAGRLERYFGSQKMFISDAAHELKTPLASIKTSLTQALSGKRNSDEYKEFLSFIANRVNAMEILINDLLLLAKVDESKPCSAKSIVDISSIVKEAGEAFRPLFEEKGIHFEVNTHNELFVKGLHKLWLRVFSNLLDNAAKNTPCDGSVTITATKEKQYVTVRVSDTGRGIPREHIDNVFERFYKVPRSNAFDSGLGLGLSICKTIVSKEGGNIELTSSVGEGSTFSIMIPIINDRHNND